jgi:hypothetical protein
MFAWLYELLLSFVSFVLSFFGIQLGSSSADQTPLTDSSQPSSTATGGDVPVETITSEEDLL